jgi:hypothetical protein
MRFGSVEKAASRRGDPVRAAAVFTELAELAERIGDRWNGAIALNNLGDVALQSGDWERVVELCGRSSILPARPRRRVGHGPRALQTSRPLSSSSGRLASAAASLRVALETSVKVDAEDGGREGLSTRPC